MNSSFLKEMKKKSKISFKKITKEQKNQKIKKSKKNLIKQNKKC